MQVKQRWSDLWQKLGAQSPPEPIFVELVQLYRQPQRAYHTLEHIQDCLHEFDQVRSLTERENEIELALWCHDVIYDPRAVDNEAQSAEWAARILSRGRVASEVSERVQAVILSTRHQALPDNSDAALVTDIDLSILGRPVAEFDRYEAAIRQEYQWVPVSAYREARLKVLETFIARPSMFQTPYFQDRYEIQARVNLKRSIQNLRDANQALV